MSLTLVLFTDVDGGVIRINPLLVTGLADVPTDLLPVPGPVAGTYVDLGGPNPTRVAVAGTQAATATALTSGGGGGAISLLKFTGAFEGAAGAVTVMFGDAAVTGGDSVPDTAGGGYPWTGPAAVLGPLGSNCFLNTLAAGTTTVELYINNAGTGIAVVHPATTTGVLSDLGTVAVNPGDIVKLRSTNTAGVAGNFFVAQATIRVTV
jgi:hypothetical protein